MISSYSWFTAEFYRSITVTRPYMASHHHTTTKYQHNLQLPTPTLAALCLSDISLNYNTENRKHPCRDYDHSKLKISSSGSLQRTNTKSTCNKQENNTR